MPARGTKFSEEARKAISERMQGNKNSLGYKQSLEHIEQRVSAHRGKSSWAKGKKFSEEHKKRISLSKLGNTNRLGKIWSEKSRIKISNSIKNLWENNPERKNKQSARSKGNNWANLRKWTPEYRKKLSESSRFHALADLPYCKCPFHNSSARLGRAMWLSGTKIEKLLEMIILAEFPEVITQKEFPPYLVDCYLPPPYHLVFEADGEYWHRFPKKDAARDSYLLRKYGVPVIRLKEKEILEVCRGAG